MSDRMLSGIPPNGCLNRSRFFVRATAYGIKSGWHELAQQRSLCSFYNQLVGNLSI